MCLRVNHYSKFSKVLNSERAFFLIVCFFPQVILTLILLFILSWGTSVISVNYFNYNRGSSANYLMVIARFANIIFIALSPVILAVGHRQLRSCIKSTLVH